MQRNPLSGYTTDSYSFVAEKRIVVKTCRDRMWCIICIKYLFVDTLRIVMHILVYLRCSVYSIIQARTIVNCSAIESQKLHLWDSFSLWMSLRIYSYCIEPIEHIRRYYLLRVPSSSPTGTESSIVQKYEIAAFHRECKSTMGDG